ncbi:MAG: bifunctional phosphoribosylaminoimidazolecarboxamide formyltransferase/IMP cyclohydrolase [Aquificaceae bacterium]|nr:bifunctional phosphoribosylaminoimidazolecarboxamide formyltransferase/IMP cyclohydrolase [Aquificaceae bacterium]MDW8237281.1 bifunctional phosphoribosylaminoimidazolecarboxamide formyltransferase/IMP cyclohydrolase [Aquificaceae bacterium]
MRALISVYEKDRLEVLLKALKELNAEILSTAGTASFIQSLGYGVTKLESITGFSELLGGRVKSLHPMVFAPILMRSEDASDNLLPIDLVVVNFYPFEKGLEDGDNLVELIDIGGPALVRAGAKNFERVCVVIDPDDYDWVARKLLGGDLTLEDRKNLASKAFSYCAYLDAMISNALSGELQLRGAFPYKLEHSLRYGENPHQKAWLLSSPLEKVGMPIKLSGKEMSYNNYLDFDCAQKLVLGFKKPACAIIKHATPASVAIGKSALEAFEIAFDAEPESAFGGVVAFNDAVDENLANKLIQNFIEMVIAPEFYEGAFDILKSKKNLRVIRSVGTSSGLSLRSISGGFLLQEEPLEDSIEPKVVCGDVSSHQMEDLLFAWRVVSYARSNAVVIVKNLRTLSIGSGNTSRVDSLRCAIMRANRNGFDLNGAVLASDGFFPFPDSVELAYKAGIRAIIQPGGSIRDQEVIEKAKELGVSMLFTNKRVFSH